MTIRIRTLYGGWREVTEAQARAWVQWMMAHITTPIDRTAWLSERVDGIDIEKLLGGRFRWPRRRSSHG